MHKRIVNQAIIELAISPVGPLLIKASDQGADPTKPDMEFVETYHADGRSPYLPGSSLKGAIRAHCERIVRTLGGERPREGNVWACDPLERNSPCQDLGDRHQGNTAAIYKASCTICQIFGSHEIGSHLRITDAYPVDSEKVKREERNGVAIDRVYGSVAVGPFNFEVITAGEFTTTITVKNFTTAQLALIALAIRDFDEQRVSIGFAKSRGLGQVNMKFKCVAIHYPTGIVEGSQLKILGRPSKEFTDTQLVVGAGELVTESDQQAYGFPESDAVETEIPIQADALGLGATLNFQTEADITRLWSGCVSSWCQSIQGA